MTISQPGNRVLPAFRFYTGTASLLAVIIGVAVTLGWLFDIESLKSVRPGMATMKANSAMAFICAGISLWLSRSEGPSPLKARVAQALAGLVLLIGLLTLGEHVSGRNFGIDELLVKDLLTAQGAFPGRMSPLTALCFSLIGLGLLFVNSRSAQYFAIIAAVLSLLAVIGYIFDFESLYHLKGFSSVALHTALTLLIVSLGIPAARPMLGAVRTLVSDLPGSRSLRFLLPVTITFTIFLAWIVEQGERTGILNAGNESAVLVILLILVYSPLTYFNAEKINQSEERFRMAVEAAPNAIILVERSGRIVLVNSQVQKFFGYERDELLGKNVEQLVPARFQEVHSEHRAGFHVHPQARAMGAGRELYGFRKDGSEFPVEIGLAPIAAQEGKLVLASIVDISERKQADEALRLNEQRFRALTENSWDSVALFGKDGTILYGGPSTRQILGYELDEFVGRNAFELIHQDDQAFVTERLMISLQKPGEHVNVYARVLHKNGSWRWLEGTFTNLLAEPSVQAIVNNYHDFTERKRSEQELRENEQKFSIMFEKAPFAATLSKLPEGIILEANEAFEGAFGYSKQEVTGKTSLELGINPDPEGRARIIAQLQTQGSAHDVELALRTKSGAVRDFRVNIDVVDIGGQRYTLQTAQDITERKQAEKKLQQQNQRLKALREIDTAILAADSVENIVGAALSHIRELIDCQRAAMALIDWGTNEVLILDVRTTGETSASKGTRMPLMLFQNVSQSLTENQPLLINDLTELPDLPPLFQTLSREGLRSVCTLPLFSQGNLIGSFNLSSEIAGFFDDEKVSLGREVANQVAIAITQSNLLNALQELNANLEERVAKRTAELSQANALLTAMMENIPDQIYFKDIHSRFIRNSISQAKMMGLNDPAETVGKSDFDFFPHAQRSFDEEQEVMRSGQPIVDLEEYVVWPDSQVTWVSTTKVPFRDPEGRIIGIFGISRDITERKRAEEALRKAKDDMQAANKELESFSYSVSHDLRAPLRAIDGFARILLEDYVSNLDEEGKRYFGVIRKEAQRMGTLIDDLLAFSRLGRKELRVTSIDMQALAGMVFEELVPENERGRIDFQVGNLPSIVGDPTLFRQVWVNLISNAVKFTSKKDRAVIEVTAQQDGNEIVYNVHDNGAGFDMEYAGKLFGVFQRLHGESEFEGTGVGLAIVQRVIHRHGGRVWAQGEVDRGATFHFALPVKGESL